jgi:hypothetical protein
MIGATGQFAGLVVPELKKKGVVVRALVQDAGKAAIAKTRGAGRRRLRKIFFEYSISDKMYAPDHICFIFLLDFFRNSFGKPIGIQEEPERNAKES